jgi:2-aminoadipate transaminase
VAFVPGSAFHPRGGGANTCRLNFSYCTPEVIEEGIRRLGEVLWRQLRAGQRGFSEEEEEAGCLTPT